MIRKWYNQTRKTFKAHKAALSAFMGNEPAYDELADFYMWKVDRDDLEEIKVKINAAKKTLYSIEDAVKRAKAKLRKQFPNLTERELGHIVAGAYFTINTKVPAA